MQLLSVSVLSRAAPAPLVFRGRKLLKRFEAIDSPADVAACSAGGAAFPTES